MKFTDFRKVAAGFLILLVLFAQKVNAQPLRVIYKDGTERTFKEVTFDFFFKVYQKIEADDEYSAMIQENDPKKVVFSATEFELITKLYSWTQVPLTPIPALSRQFSPTETFPVTEEKQYNRFYFVDPSKKHPVISTNKLRDCILVIAHNRVSRRSFVAHISDLYSRYQREDVTKGIREAFEKLGLDDLENIQVTLITRQYSKFGQSVYDGVKNLGLEPQVSAIPGYFQVNEYDPILTNPVQQIRSEQYINPKLMSFTEFLDMRVDYGREIFFDSRDGMIFELRK